QVVKQLPGTSEVSALVQNTAKVVHRGVFIIFPASIAEYGKRVTVQTLGIGQSSLRAMNFAEVGQHRSQSVLIADLAKYLLGPLQLVMGSAQIILFLQYDSNIVKRRCDAIQIASIREDLLGSRVSLERLFEL